MQYTIRHHPRSKYMRLSINPTGEVFVTAPKHMTKEYIERFIFKKMDWIQDKLDYIEKHPPSIHKIKSSKVDYKKYKDQALVIVKEKILKFNMFYNFPIKNLSIKNQKTRWGSCSRKGNININYKIALLPDHLAEYLIVHELCHLGQFDHSHKFWDLVGKTIPDYRQKRKELRLY